MHKKASSSAGIFCVIIASFFWGTTGTTASFMPDVSPLATGAGAMGFGGLLLVLQAYRQLYRDRYRLLAHIRLLLAGSLSVAIYPLAFYSSMRLSGVAIGTLISIASAPFFTFLIERLISKKVMTLQWLLSFLFGAVGMTLLTLGRQGGGRELSLSADLHV